MNMLLPPETKLRQGNVFTRICDSVHRGKGVSVEETPWNRDPTQRSPYGQRPPWTETPFPLDRDPRQRPLLDTDPPLGQRPPRQRPPGQRPPYGNEREVRILLECILVLAFVFTTHGSILKLNILKKSNTC